MRFRPVLAMMVMGMIGGASLRAQEPKAAPQARPDDVKSADALIAALYDVISGEKGQERDWNRFRSLFVPGARLIPVVRTREGQTATRAFTVEEFATMAGEATKRDGFFESEIARKTEQFGAVTHAFSTYVSRHEKDGKPFDRGINSIQLLNDGTRWWVVTIYWDRETPETSIPAEYLPKK